MATKAEPTTAEHKVERDYVGFSNTPRFTCYTCGSTLVCWAWRTQAEIDPHTTVIDGGFRG